ncbi:hypothetical protein [Telmatospirillum sp.]|uniref:hypothetical protein n=1 Tax=Telmatospirillum sp. TaxID=2079197 RepID=UPI0028490626|nr:hypothetical protein [Telmatospirillum sp.]MDR3439640.1 hypothetical protein [Telmatospirillum sp.]
MPTEPKSVTPPAGHADQSLAATQQEAALFEALLARVRAATDKAHLLERSEAVLRLILDREDDRGLRADLDNQIARVVGAVPDNVTTGPGPIILAKAVAECLHILTTAEQRRVAHRPSPTHRNPSSVETAAAYERHAHAKPAPVVVKSSPPRTIALVVALAAVLAAGLAIGLHSRGENKGPAEPPLRPLVAQVEAAVHGAAPPGNIFGGGLQVTRENGRVFVTLTGIPAGECVLSGWDLVRKGILTINGTTPNRVSAAILNELCHDDDTATLRWTPRAAN